MKILVTGSKGFIGSNLCLYLSNHEYEVYGYDIGFGDGTLKHCVASSDFIIHLAGINRPLKPEEFIDGNVNLAKKLLDVVLAAGFKAPIIFSSSTQAALDNTYGQSKKKAEEELFAFQKKNNHPVYVFRLYNAFGKWCRPNYNSVIATFCYNVAHNLPLQINEAAPASDCVYIDDIVASFMAILSSDGHGSKNIVCPEPHYSEKLGEIAKALYQFKA